MKLTKRQVITITPKPSVQLKRRGEIHKHHDNVTTILRHSNATPIRSKGSLGYTCSFCTNQYPEASDLKSHTLTTHEKQNLIFRRGHTMLTFMVKLDITSLHCNICGKNCNLIEDLVQHLTIEHDKPYHTDIKNYLVPFKFDSDVLRCVICHNKFNNFKVLLEHMNSHFKNHICEVCGEGFVNKRILLSHSYRHKKGVFNCTHCNKVFDTKVKQKEHERAVHICMNRRNKCGYCGEKFTDYTKKNEHEVRLHGAKPVLLKCQACNRTFDNQRALTVHTKSYHLLEGRMRK